MYNNYMSFVGNITVDNIKTTNFKSNSTYNSILEHVSYEHGKEYLHLIETNYSNIEFSNVLDYFTLNDTYGYPNLYEYKNKTGTTFKCSSTSLRYVYHALLILEHYQKNTNQSIVEVGCGYGGLFLAICHFSTLLNINVKNYHIIDLDPVCKLIAAYLDINKYNITIEYKIHSSTAFGQDIDNEDMFFISNYCFTELDTVYRNNYIINLLPKCSSGFIIWQTCFGYNIDEANELLTVTHIEEERPQTSGIQKNYFVYF